MSAIEKQLEDERAEFIVKKLQAAKQSGSVAIMNEVMIHWRQFMFKRCQVEWRINMINFKMKAKLDSMEEVSLRLSALTLTLTLTHLPAALHQPRLLGLALAQPSVHDAPG